MGHKAYVATCAPVPIPPSYIVLKPPPHIPHPNSNCKTAKTEKPTQTTTKTWDGETPTQPIPTKRKKSNNLQRISCRKDKTDGVGSHPTPKFLRLSYVYNFVFFRYADIGHFADLLRKQLRLLQIPVYKNSTLRLQCANHFNQLGLVGMP